MNYNIIGKLKNGDGLLGTCFLVSPEYVLSAFHNIEELDNYDDLQVEFKYANESRKLNVIYKNKKIDFLVMKIDSSIEGLEYTQIYDRIPVELGDEWETVGYPGEYEYEDIEDEYLKGNINRIIEHEIYDIELNIFDQKDSVTWSGVSGAPLIVYDNIVGIILQERRSMIKNKLRAISMNKITDYLYSHGEEDLLLSLSYKKDNPLTKRLTAFKKECIDKFYSYKYNGNHFDMDCLLLKPMYNIEDLIDMMDLFLIDYAHSLEEISIPKDIDLREKRIYERKIKKSTEKLKKILINNNKMILVLLWLILEGNFDTPRVAFMMSMLNPNIKRDIYVNINDNRVKLLIGYAEICNDISLSISSMIEEIDKEINTEINCTDLFIWDNLAVNYLDINSRKKIEAIINNKDSNKIHLDITIFASYDSEIYTNGMYNFINENPRGIESMNNIEMQTIQNKIVKLGQDYDWLDVTAINWIMTPVGSIELFKEELQSFA